MILLTLILPKFVGINGVFYAEAIAGLIAVIITNIIFLSLFNNVLEKKNSELSI